MSRTTYSYRHFLSVLLLLPSLSYSAIRLPAVISDNMVLQQQARAALWGWGDPGEKVYITASWGTGIDSGQVNSDGKWNIKINTPVAGGPYTITLKGWNSITLKNILVGEVWVCSGQSNMEWSSNNNNRQILDELPHSANHNIRLFHIPRTSAEDPQEDCRGNWEVCGPESLKGFSVIGYFFGKKLQASLGVPVGLIMSAWGGTPVEVWTPSAVINENPVMRSAASKLSETPWGPYRPGLLFNGMIAPITGFEIAGAIWYQGESNVDIARSYQTTFSAMIKSWRQLWKKNFPFYFVQIAPYHYGDNLSGALLREQQAKTLSLDNTGMVVITDLVNDVNNIHPDDKAGVSERLANLALARTYNRSAGPGLYPSFSHMDIKKEQVTVYFDNIPNGLKAKGKKVTGFYIAGEDKKFYPAEARILTGKVILKNKAVKNPVAVRFGFSNTATPDLFSKEGLPVVPFRTDDWDSILTIPKEN